MKISYNWLCDYIEVDLSPERMAGILTDIGLEVDALERVESVRGGLAGVVVGEVASCEKHPDADKLSLTQVDVGSETLQIVCGAPNVAAGQKVLVATVGATLYPAGSDEPFKIKRSKIRGVESLGMICAEDELGIGNDHSGIMTLPAEARVGAPAAEVLGLQGDWMIEIGLTPNRIDAASHIGVARDLAAYCKTNGIAARFAMPSVDDFVVDSQALPIAVEVRCTEGAPRYAGVSVTGLKAAPSPQWMQNYLKTIGINPKNNIVDITNFILHELGQPLHAFDADRIEGGRIVVRTCPEGTPFVTLDGVERKLSADDLMICDAAKPMCIAGVFGGAGSGISDGTRNVFIESAYFNPVWIRKSARRHGLNTDASFRFERGIDPNITIYALKCAALMMKELAGGTINSEIVDLYPDPIADFRFDISFAKINSLIGNEIPPQTVRGIIAALDVRIEREADGVMSVAVPPYRVDVQRDVDLIEEILRLYGYNNVEIPAHVRSSLAAAPKPDRGRMAGAASEFLTANGFTEIMSNSLTRAAYYEQLASYPRSACVEIINPLSSDLNVMRQTLLFNVLEAVELNINRRRNDLKLYELGNCYRYDAGAASDDLLSPYVETMRLGVAVTGQEQAPSWNVSARPSGFFTLRAITERLLARFGVDIYGLRCESSDCDLFSEGLVFSQGNRELMRMGTVAAPLLKQFDVKQSVKFLEMDFDALMRAAARRGEVKVQELNKFPSVKRDLALLLDKGVTFSELRRIAFETERKLLRSVSLFDVYEGDKLEAGKKSYALSFTLEDPSRTLTDEVIERTMTGLVKQFEARVGATVRT
ncbi:MAG: phenylalanine--tRNA ligase subunit beta [Rikenellaceae bacterium]|jgi:phenylalanyl-tRNA synthetase beta chain|nr:phenylalanine--tRNA ligase subunit beta [Rikenellaceae bacterium]